jgi:hypothetical protein
MCHIETKLSGDQATLSPRFYHLRWATIANVEIWRDTVGPKIVGMLLR